MRITAACEKFFTAVDSAGVYLNASTRFADGFRYGLGPSLELAPANSTRVVRLDLKGLSHTKYKLIGEGHTVAMYSGRDARRFIHKPC